MQREGRIHFSQQAGEIWVGGDTVVGVTGSVNLPERPVGLPELTVRRLHADELHQSRPALSGEFCALRQSSELGIDDVRIDCAEPSES